MAGYSGTPLVKKLGIKANQRIALINPPPDFGQVLGELPAEVTVHPGMRGRACFDLIILFANSQSRLQQQFPALVERLIPSGGLWVAWPKQTSGVRTDLSEGVVRTLGLAAGLVDNKVCAVDETWSGLRFVIRLRDRPAGAG